MNSRGIAIIGAGIAGLTAALALAARGLGVTVYEQARELGEIGAGLHVSPNGMKVMRALGMEGPVLACAARPRSICTRHYASGELINYVALIEEDGWHDEAWITRADSAVLSAGFSGWNAAVRALIGRTLSGECYKWALLGRHPMAHWSTLRTTLVGDAAHPMVPYLAQGAVMAMEDAWVLAACIAGNTDAASSVAAYERARVERANAVQAAAWEQGQLNHAVGRDARGDDFHGGSFADPAWIYGYDPVASFPL